MHLLQLDFDRRTLVLQGEVAHNWEKQQVSPCPSAGVNDYNFPLIWFVWESAVFESDRSSSSLSDSVMRLAGRFLGSRAKESHFSNPLPLDQVDTTDNGSPLGMRAHELIEAQVRVTPENVAVSFDDGYITYQQLDRRANQLANYLRSMGVGPGTCVAVFLERGLAMVVALLATLKSGAAYLPMDPMFPQERLAFMLNDAQVPVVLSQRSLTGNRNFGAARVVQLDRDAEEIAAESTEKPEEITAPENLAYVIFTSGSPGN